MEETMHSVQKTFAWLLLGYISTNVESALARAFN